MAAYMQKYEEKAKSSSYQAMVNAARDGVESLIVREMQAEYGVDNDFFVKSLSMSWRQILRYMQSGKKLPLVQSERILQLIALYEHGRDVFGSIKNFNDWLASKILSLNHQKPGDFLDSSTGIQLVNSELGKIEYGIY